jgi:hypothetical protein
LEADWLRTYARDLREDLFGEAPIGARRLRALIEGLPPDAMLWRRVPGWGSDQELLALNAEVTHSIVRVLISAYSKKGAKVPKPLKVPRPTADRAAPRSTAKRLTPDVLGQFGVGVARGAPDRQVVP